MTEGHVEAIAQEATEVPLTKSQIRQIKAMLERAEAGETSRAEALRASNIEHAVFSNTPFSAGVPVYADVLRFLDSKEFEETPPTLSALISHIQNGSEVLNQKIENDARQTLQSGISEMGDLKRTPISSEDVPGIVNGYTQRALARARFGISSADMIRSRLIGDIQQMVAPVVGQGAA